MGKKTAKGTIGYIQAKRIQVLLRTIIYFAAALAIFAVGYLHTGTKQNLLTVLAILGCLPGCKSMVNLIMFLRALGCSREAAERINACIGTLDGMYDMYFTSYRENFAISHLVMTDHAVIGVTEAEGCDCKAAREHLETMLKQGGISDVKVSIGNQMEQYCGQLREMNQKYQGTEFSRTGEIRQLLSDISL